MNGRDIVEVDMRLRLDPLEPDGDRAGCTRTTTIDGVPLVIVRDLVTVDELALGHLVAMILTEAEAT